jgi:hypothetical protein
MRMAGAGRGDLLRVDRDHKMKTPLDDEVAAGSSLRAMGLGRVELPTSRLSGVRSNHLSYRPRSGLSIEN